MLHSALKAPKYRPPAVDRDVGLERVKTEELSSIIEVTEGTFSAFFVGRLKTRAMEGYSPGNQVADDDE